MPDLTRNEFCTVAAISPNALASLSRRNQLPFSIDQKASGRGYTFFEVFLTIMSQDFVEGHGVNVTRAADIAAALPAALQLEWPRVVGSAWKLCEGTGEKVTEIMCGRFQTAGRQQPKPICGTTSEIATLLDKMDGAKVRLILSNASRGLAVLINRSHKLKLEIPETFWTEPFAYRERSNIIDPVKSNMLSLIDEGAHMKMDDQQ